MLIEESVKLNAMMEDGIEDRRKFGDGMEDFYDGLEMEWKKFSG